MDKQEYFLIIPGIVYGVIIVDLMKVFMHRKNYWEMVVWGIYMFTMIPIVWSELFQKLDLLTNSLKNYFIIIIQAVLYTVAVKLLTPEEKDEDTKAYFMEIKRPFFLLIAGIAFLNFVLQFTAFADQRPAWMRPVGFVLLLACAYWDKIWIRAMVWAFFFCLAINYILMY